MSKKIHSWRRNKGIERKQNQESKHGKAGYVYLMKSNNLYKIGLTGNWEKRLKRLKTGNPNIEKVIAKRVEDCKEAESKLHKRYKSKRESGEWFSLTDQDIKDIDAFLDTQQPKGYTPHEIPEAGLKFESFYGRGLRTWKRPED